uniref:Uncharacterized protein LOC104265655 n=1 Tax=Phallusia mammillata TaxID=59560 RepID=A0A6F9DI61_9ASCI|nr:uncharacterized protein LOC104265655 [Phallusia mammillata]
MITDICEQHPEHRVYVGTSWVGHEDLLEKLSANLKEYVFVDSDFFSRLQLLEVVDVFKTGSSCRLNAVPNSKLTCSSIAEWNKEMPTIGIKPTAMFGGQCTTGSKSAGMLHCVPYSNHCNFLELTEFVKLVAPKHIKPIVPGRKYKSGMESMFRADMRQLDNYLCITEENTDFQTKSDNLKSGMNKKENLQQVQYKKHQGKVKRMNSLKIYLN